MDTTRAGVSWSHVWRKLRYCLIVTSFALVTTFILIILLEGPELLQTYIWTATVVPMVVAPPIAYLGMHRKIQIESLAERLQFALDYDSLTRAHSRQVLMERFDDAPHEKALIMVDADHFKRINDRFGHLVGDHTLRYLAGVMRQHVRKTDIVSRYGGEEFVILLSETTREEAIDVCNRLSEFLNTAPLETFQLPTRVTVSMGLTMCREGESIDDALARADTAVFEAKNAGRNQLKIADPALRQSA